MTRLILGLCFSILCLVWASTRPAGLAMALPAPAGWSFFPSPSSRELMGGDQTIPALFVPRLPGAQGFSGTMAQSGEASVCWGVRPYCPQHA